MSATSESQSESEEGVQASDQRGLVRFNGVRVGFYPSMGPDDGLNELLPVAPAREEKHQAEGPNKVSTKEEQPVAQIKLPTMPSQRVHR